MWPRCSARRLQSDLVAALPTGSRVPDQAAPARVLRSRSGELWNVVERAGPVAELVVPMATNAPTAVVCRPAAAAVVLGSTQSEADFDLSTCAERGFEVVRRRSGGGAVVVKPRAQAWVDVYVPRQHPLFRDDVTVAFSFVGHCWAAAIKSVFQNSAMRPDVSIWGSRPEPNRWSALFCFASLGAGEVLVDGRKAVGISQRRDRAGAWFHSMALLEMNPEEIAHLIADRALASEAGAFLSSFAGPVPPFSVGTLADRVPADQTRADLMPDGVLASAFLAALP